MSNPDSGYYDAQIFSQYFCFTDNCGISNTNLNWSCNNAPCTSININGTLPTPKIIPEVGSPTLTVGLPQLNNISGWSGGTATITNSQSGCLTGTLDSISNSQNQMKFKMSGQNMANFCKNSQISATLQTESITCKRIPFLDVVYCYDKNRPHQYGFFDYINCDQPHHEMDKPSFF